MEDSKISINSSSHSSQYIDDSINDSDDTRVQAIAISDDEYTESISRKIKQDFIEETDDEDQQDSKENSAVKSGKRKTQGQICLCLGFLTIDVVRFFFPRAYIPS